MKEILIIAFIYEGIYYESRFSRINKNLFTLEGKELLFEKEILFILNGDTTIEQMEKFGFFITKRISTVINSSLELNVGGYKSIDTIPTKDPYVIQTDEGFTFYDLKERTFTFLSHHTLRSYLNKDWINVEEISATKGQLYFKNIEVELLVDVIGNLVMVEK